MRRGRPRTDRMRTLERVGYFLIDNPEASASLIARELRIRKLDAIRAKRLLTRLAGRFPNSGDAA